MKRELILFACSSLTASLPVLAASKVPDVRPGPDEARIRAIMPLLSERAKAPGRPISDRAAWDRLAATPEACGHVAEAEKLVGLEMPDCSEERWLEFFRSGSRRAYERPYYDRSTRVEKFVLAEALENRGRFIPEIVRYLNAICDERVWLLPAHDREKVAWERRGSKVGLFSAARALYLGRWLGIVGERLPPELVSRIRRLVRERVTDPFLACCRLSNADAEAYAPCHWFCSKSNWNAVCCAGCAGAILALDDDRRRRAEAVEACERSLAYYLGGFKADGYNEEGPEYWNFGFGHYLYIGLAIREATDGRVDLFAGERPRLCAAFAVKCLLEPGLATSFADGAGAPRMLNLAYCRQIWPESFPVSATRLPLLAGFTKGIYQSSIESEYAFRAFGQAPAPVGGEDVLPRRTYFKDGAVLISRLAPGSKRRFAMAVRGGGNADMHNHDDLGSYTIALDGNVLTGDPGREWYTARTFSSRRYESKYLSSYGHPVPKVNGCLQAHGEEFRVKIVSTDFADDRDAIVIDLAGAYPEKANVRKLVRTVVFERAAQAVTVTDEVELSEPGAFEVPVVTSAEAVWTSAKERLFLTRERPEKVYAEEFPGLDVKVSATGGDWSWRTELMENPYFAAAKRLAVAFDRPVKTATVSVRFAAAAAQGGK